MKVVICGSIKHLEQLVYAKEILTSLGLEVLLPHKAELFLKEKDFDETTSAKKKNWYMREHLKKIDQGDVILVINEDKNGARNYIGGNTLLEMGYAFSLGKPIFLKNPIPELPYSDEIQGMLPIVLNDIEEIVNYVEGTEE